MLESGIFLFLLEITLQSSPLPLYLFWLSTRKIQIPQDTNSLSQNNYKMLYATVNTTSVTVTVCICHEMRQKQNEFALMNRMKIFFFFVCVCLSLADCYGHLFQPHHKWALMFHTGFAAEESRFVWEHLVLTDCLFYPPPIQHEKPGTLYCLPCSLDCFYFLHLWLCKLNQLWHSSINQYRFRNAIVFIDYKF